MLEALCDFKVNIYYFIKFAPGPHPEVYFDFFKDKMENYNIKEFNFHKFNRFIEGKYYNLTFAQL